MKQRWIRILVYEGTPEWIQMNIEKRGVKGSYHAGPNGSIKEAIVGDFLEEVVERIVPEVKMTKDDIGKLPTPLTDAEVVRRNIGHDWIPADFARSLEQRLATAVMIIERAMRVSDLSLDKEAGETLRAIRGDK